MELAVLGGAALLFLALLLPALRYARQEARDAQRREAVLAAKRELENMYNRTEQYPLVHDPAGEVVYTVTKAGGEQAPKHTGSGQALGWYVRIPLELMPAPTSGFDLEHNVYFRFVREGPVTFYDICGGTDTCGASEREREE